MYTLLVALSLAAAPTQIQDEAAGRRLLGEHDLTLQWVSWETPGKAVVQADAEGVWRIHGEQVMNGERLSIDGAILRVDSNTFTFDGTIVTQVSYIAGGKTCTRTGPATFTIKGKRRYWRLQEMTNPCDAVTDYVDVYLRPGE